MSVFISDTFKVRISYGKINKIHIEWKYGIDGCLFKIII